MIFSKTKLTQPTVLIRFYHYMDCEKGYGDVGTAGYAKVPLNALVETVNETFDGGAYYTYHLDALTSQIMKDRFGKDYYMTHGYELATEEDRLAEIAKTKELLKALEAVDC